MLTASYDVIVVGAGPGGAVAAGLMARGGLRVLLADKAVFPRDKICGDAISKKAVEVLQQLELTEKVQAAQSLGSYGVTLSSTRGDTLSMSFEDDLGKEPPSYVSARLAFDDVLFRYAVESGAEVWQNTTVEGLIQEGGRVVGVRVKRQAVPNDLPTADSRQPTAEEILAPLVIGADGAYSAVAKGLGMDQLDEEHYCAGLRAYYEGVTGFHEHGHIEIHFVDEVIPGYFWIFPMEGGRANVGVGMLSSTIKKRDARLKELLRVCVEHPRFRDRFAGARQLGATKGWGLPLGSRPRPMAGDGWLLVGDAASLIDPFTGEGIGNAMLTGRMAAAWALKAAAAQDQTAAFLKGYEQEVLARIGDELKLSYAMQRLGNWKWLLDTTIRKVSRSPELTRSILRMVDDEAERRKLVNPIFYLRLLMA